MLGLLLVWLVPCLRLDAASCYPTPAGLTGWWPGEGNANDSAGTNNGTLQGGATANTAGSVGMAFSFDGTNSFVQIADSPTFHPTNLTVEAWVRFTSLDSAASGSSPPGEQYIIFKQNSRNGSFEGFDLGKERVGANDFIRFMVASAAGAEVEVFSAAPVTTGVWYHVAGVRGSNFIALYINGQLQNQAAVGFPQDYGNFPLFFGSSGQAFWDHKFKGLLDEPSLYNRALSSNEIASIYAAGAAGKCGPPRILSQPQSQTVGIGTNATFTVAATGTMPLTYQWQFAGGTLVGPTSSSLTITNAQLTNAGNYSVVVSGPGGVLTSSVAVLTVLLPPTLDSQPASRTNLLGTTATFAASASGSEPLGYQWRFNGTAMTNGGRASGVTTTNLVITNAQYADAGNYTMVVTNAVGVVTSAVAVLFIPSPPSITAQPTNLTAIAGSNALFSVSVGGTPPFTYQWRFGATDLPSGTSSVLTLATIQPTDAGGYSVVVSNFLGAVTSTVASLTVLVPPSFISQPVSATNVLGTTASFFGGASGTAPLGYRWQFNGAQLTNGGRFSGATSTNLGITNAQSSDAGNYTLVASNAAAVATSAVATLTILLPPSIVAQPTNQTVVMGSNTLLIVNATGTAPLSYQWRFGGTNIADASTSALSLSNVQPADAGSYSVVISNVVSSVTSAVATLTVLVPPSFVSQPVDQTNVIGTTASFSGLAAGTAPLGYRWQFNGTNLVNGGRISGATSTNLSIANAQTSDVGNYTLVASNAAAVATSTVATLTILLPPSIVTQPTNQTVVVGSNLVFVVNASGTAPLSYQWRFAGTNLPDATTTALNLANVQPADAGGYSVVITNVVSSVTSAVATLTVLVPPAFTSEPVSATNVIGTTASFSGLAAGTTPIGYRWQFNGVNLTNGGRISGATSTSLGITNAQPADAGNYTLVASNAAAIATSTVATLTVLLPPSIVTQPTNQTLVMGSNATFVVNASGSAPLAYQWRLAGTNLEGASSSTLNLANIQPADAGGYSVVITNAAGSLTSAVATLTVLVPPSFISQPVSATNVIGTTASFAGLAAGTAPISYRWQFNGTNLTNNSRISGVTTTNLTITNALSADAGNYTLVASNTAAVGTSAVATLTVLLPPAITAQPTNRTVVMGSNAIFTVSVSGSAPLIYQWRLGETNLPGATASVLNLSNVQPADAGNYSVVITNGAAAIISTVATLTVRVPPIITLQPASRTNVISTTASFFASAIGDLPLSYRWYRNGVALSDIGRITGATSTNLSITNSQTSDAGNYTLIVSNSVTVATSVAATLTVLVPPSIAIQPAGIGLLVGTNVNFMVTATGSPLLRYLWQKDGNNLADGPNISGAETRSLSLFNLQTNDSGNYRVVVTNEAGIATSAAAVLNVAVAPVAPSIVTQPLSQTTPLGSNATFAVTAAGTVPLSYQWLKDGAFLADGGAITGATSSALAFSGVLSSDEGGYQVVVTNAGGAVTSAIASLSVSLSQPIGADATVLVNSTSPRYSDFQRYIKPYLDNFGVPYTVRDITTNAIGTNIGQTALIIIGHRQIDTNHLFLDNTAQTNIVSAVSNGVGLVNFDTDLFASTNHRYPFIQSIFGFGYASNFNASNVTFPQTEPGPSRHYITAQHASNDVASFRGAMSLTGMVLPTNATAIALSAGKPFVAIRSYGKGRVIQWASLDWTPPVILGPMEGLDDLIWRGLIWSARKPFVMRLMPNFVTTRWDDCSGPFWWVHTMNEFGFKPFIAANISEVASTNIPDLRLLCTNGLATASPHAFFGLNLIYFNYGLNTNYSDPVISNNMYIAKQWHITNGIPMSKTITTHYSEIGTNALPWLLDWGAEYLPIEVPINSIEYSPPYAPWLIGGPYRLYEPPLQGQTNLPMYYADFLAFPNQPQVDGKFFNCYTEIRDAGTCGQWCPYNNVPVSITDGTAIVKRCLDSKVRATLFSHEQAIQSTASVPNGQPITSNNWRTIVSGVVSNLAPYQPLYVTLDYSDQYTRATRTSRILSGTFDLASGQVTANFSGKADLDMQVQVYLDNAGSNLVATIPAFTNGNSSPLALLPAPPLVLSQPPNTTNGAGCTAVLRAGIGGSLPLTCQWVFNGTNLLSDGARINGAGSWALAIANLSSADVGLYTLIVSNAYGSVTSAPAMLAIVDPYITTPPGSRLEHAGQTAVFQAQVAGSPPLVYQWFRNGTTPLADDAKISGATSPTLTIADVLGGDRGTYSLLASNSMGAVTTTPPALLSVIDPVLLSQPLNRTNHEGSPASFSVQAYGTAPTFQWIKDFNVLDDATNSTLTLPSVSPADSGDYAVIVSNVFGNLVSAAATLTVVAPLRIESVGANEGSVVITWSAIPGSTYSLQQIATLDDTNWTDLWPPITAPGSTASATNTINPEGYYRVHLLP